jgi:uncharacterized protein
LTGRVVDTANLFNPAERAVIEAELAALEGASTDQLAVVTVQSLDGYAIEDYAIGLARQWQLGQKDVDNGVLLLVAPNDRKVRIEVGRRLEPLLTDTMARLIIENAILPKFRRGDFAGGVYDGVRDIKSVLLGDAEELKRRAASRDRMQQDWAPFIHLLVWLLILSIVVWNIYYNPANADPYETAIGPDGRPIRRRRQHRYGPIVITTGGPGSSRGGWSGGGGGRGGWSGGGGSFGGGGASGSW